MEDMSEKFQKGRGISCEISSFCYLLAEKSFAFMTQIYLRDRASKQDERKKVFVLFYTIINVFWNFWKIFCVYDTNFILGTEQASKTNEKKNPYFFVPSQRSSEISEKSSAFM